MKVPKAWWMVALALLGLSALVGCGETDEEPDESRDTTQGAVDDTTTTTVTAATDRGGGELIIVTLTAEIQSSFSEQGAGADVPDDEAECAATAIVDEIGEERLAELGVTPEATDALSSVMRDPANVDEREAIAAALTDCIDLVRTFSAVYAAIGLSESSAECAAEGIVDDPALRTTLLLGDEPSGETAAAFDAVAVECFTPEELAQFTSAGG